MGLTRIMKVLGSGKLALWGIAILAAFSALQTIKAERFKNQAQASAHSEMFAIGNLAACSARLENILEAIESDASIPNDLRDFAVPPEWLRTVPVDAASDAP